MASWNMKWRPSRLTGSESGKLEFLVQWLGYSSAHDEWLKEEDLGNAQAKLGAYKRANGLP